MVGGFFVGGRLNTLSNCWLQLADFDYLPDHRIGLCCRAIRKWGSRGLNPGPTDYEGDSPEALTSGFMAD